jgi:hypothetical protein
VRVPQAKAAPHRHRERAKEDQDPLLLPLRPLRVARDQDPQTGTRPLRPRMTPHHSHPVPPDPRPER